MTDRDPEGPAAALLSNLRAGLHDVPARKAAGVASARAWRALLEADPDLPRDMDEAREEGRLTREALKVESPGAGGAAPEALIYPAPPVVLATPAEVDPAPGPRPEPAEAITLAPPVNDAVRAMVARLARERAAAAPSSTAAASADPSDRWAIARREAEAIEPGHAGTLLWIDARCQASGMHALDLWWVDELRRFYRSGRLVLVVRAGLRGAKSVSICRALVNDALFTMRGLDKGVVGVIPIMSADRTEATDRFHTIRAILDACGVQSTKKDAEDAAPGGLGTTYTSTTLPSGGGVIQTVDCQGHAVEFRIYPARITGAIGYTGVAGFCDEVDLWPTDLGVSVDDVAARSAQGKANPADVVLDRLLERFTTTLTSAHLYIVSASYKGEDSAHARRVAKGDRPIQMVARLGTLGVARDESARRRLAESTGSDDPRLLTPADPTSCNIPAWVTNPAAPIESCYMLSQERIGPMLGRYGGCPDEAEGRVVGPLAGVVFQRGSDADASVDVVAGAAPSPAGWVLVIVSISPEGRLLVREVRQGLRAGGDPTPLPSVLSLHARHEPRALAEVGALLAGTLTRMPPLAPWPIYDGDVLRAVPLVTLYERGRISHAPGLDAFEAALRGHTDEAPAPLAEALVAAVARLVMCYPWLGAGGQALGLGASEGWA